MGVPHRLVHVPVLPRVGLHCRRVRATPLAGGSRDVRGESAVL